MSTASYHHPEASTYSYNNPEVSQGQSQYDSQYGYERTANSEATNVTQAPWSNESNTAYSVDGQVSANNSAYATEQNAPNQTNSFNLTSEFSMSQSKAAENTTDYLSNSTQLSDQQSAGYTYSEQAPTPAQTPSSAPAPYPAYAPRPYPAPYPSPYPYPYPYPYPSYAPYSYPSPAPYSYPAPAVAPAPAPAAEVNNNSK